MMRAMSWILPFPMRSRFEGTELFVGEWSCDGAVLPPSRELAHHHGLDLLQHGTHVRTLGRRRTVMSASRCALQLPGDEYWVTSPPLMALRGTVVLLRGEPSRRWSDTRRDCALSPTTTRLHAHLAAAREPMAVEEAALRLISSLSRDLEGNAEPAGLALSASARRLAEELQHVISRRFRERLTVHAIASACGVSPFHASRVFRAVTGQTMHRHLVRARLWASLFELRERALADVAASVGFSSHSHFTSAFKVEFGRSPTQVLEDERSWRRPASPR
jgi:AraC-like DNA-binding protein